MNDAPISLSDEPEATDDLLSENEARDLRAKHGEVVAVRTKSGVAVFRSCTRQEYARYNSMIFDEKKRAQAFEALVSTCIIKPDAKTFQHWLDKSPGITETCLNAVLELSGVERDAQTKKYSTA